MGLLDPINPIDAMMTASSLYAESTAMHLTAITEATRRQLDKYDINVRDVSSEEEAQRLIEEKKQTEQVKAQQNGETYYDKQIISDAINLAEDLGLSVMMGTDILVLMDNIQARLTQLQNSVGNNDNLKKVVDEYSNRYDYIYAQYMNKKDFLESQIITTLDAMSLTGVSVSTGL